MLVFFKLFCNKLYDPYRAKLLNILQLSRALTTYKIIYFSILSEWLKSNKEKKSYSTRFYVLFLLRFNIDNTVYSMNVFYHTKEKHIILILNGNSTKCCILYLWLFWNNSILFFTNEKFWAYIWMFYISMPQNDQNKSTCLSEERKDS